MLINQACEQWARLHSAIRGGNRQFTRQTKSETNKLSLQVDASVKIWLLIDFTDSNEHIHSQFIFSIIGAHFSKDPLICVLHANNMRTPLRECLYNQKICLWLCTCCGSSCVYIQRRGLISTIKCQKSKTLENIRNEQREAVKQREWKLVCIKGVWWRDYDGHIGSAQQTARVRFHKHVYQKWLAFTKVFLAGPHGCSAKLGLTACIRAHLSAQVWPS